MKKTIILAILCVLSVLPSFAVYKIWTYTNGNERFPSKSKMESCNKPCKELIIDFSSDNGNPVTLFGNYVIPSKGHNIYYFSNYSYVNEIGEKDTIYSVGGESYEEENQIFTRGETKYVTGYSLEPMYANNIGQIQVFVATGADEKYVYLTQIFYIPKNTPFIMKVKDISSDIYGISRLQGEYLNSITKGSQNFKNECYMQYRRDSIAITKNMLKGNKYGVILSPKTKNSGLYMLHSDNGEQKFYQIDCEGKNTISMLSCYLDLNSCKSETRTNTDIISSKCVNEILSDYKPYITPDDDAFFKKQDISSSIEVIDVRYKDKENKKNNKDIYNVSGQKVTTPVHGIFIINGQKKNI